MSNISIDPNITLNELVARTPIVLPILQGFGLDTCCGGSLSLAVAAEHHGLELGRIIALIESVLAGAPSSAITTPAE